MYVQLLRKYIQRGTLTLVDHDGVKHTFGEGEPRATWVLRDPAAGRRIVRNPMLNLGETYMDQQWDVEDGRLAELLTLLRVNLESDFSRSHNAVWLLTTLLQSWNTVRGSLSNVSHHYDLDETLFRTFLDREMYYSCAYYRDPDMSLESAQLAKANHIQAKLGLAPGDRVLDIGCGWGSLALHLAETADVEVVGVTLSEEQLRVAQAEAAKRGLDGRVEFRLEDYRHHDGRYDGIVSVGMFEHVGKRNFKRFFQHVARMLRSDGTALIHTIGQYDAAQPTNPWIRRNIFPGGYIPPMSQVMAAIEPTGLVTADVEVLRRHYAFTLKEWNRRFQAHRAQMAATKGERFCRMWEFYLVSCQTAFEASNLVVFQFQLAKTNATVPITRDYLYGGDQADIVVPEPNQAARDRSA